MERTSRRLSGLAAMILVAACQGAAPTSPAASVPATGEPPPAAAGEVYVVWILDDDGPFFNVRVDAVAPTGASRPVASFIDVHPAGWETASPFYDMRTVVGPGRLLPVVAERNGGMVRDDVRTLLLDLQLGNAPPVEVAGALERPFWGPDGQLATPAGNGPELIELRTGARLSIPRPEDVEISPAWLADGSGWPAVRYGELESTSGRLSLLGEFTEGAAGPTFQVTGLERLVGATDGTLNMAISDGFESSETAITESRPDLPGSCQCIVWARNVEPGDDPAFGEAVWDATGTGIWIVFSNGHRRWLSHLVAPEIDRPVADLPAADVWWIAGISTDDRWVVVASEGGSLALVDAAAGAAREIARAQGEVNPAPMFGGWVR